MPEDITSPPAGVSVAHPIHKSLEAHASLDVVGSGRKIQ